MRTKYLSCSDGFCGATDCPKCSPHCFRGGMHVDDIEAQEIEKAESEATRQWGCVMDWIKKKTEGKTHQESMAVVAEVLRTMAQPEDAQCDRYILELREAMGI